MKVNYFAPKFIPPDEFCTNVTKHQCKMCENYSPDCHMQKAKKYFMKEVGKLMFTAEKAKHWTDKVTNGRVNSWEQLQFEIRTRAMQGFDYYYLENERYLLLVNTLQVFGYTVEFDSAKNLWCVLWGNLEEED